MIRNKKILFTGAALYLLCSAVFIYAEQNELENELNYELETPADFEARQTEYSNAVEYLREFNESSLSSHKKLTHMHKRSNLAKLGREKINGEISGTCEYWARVRGFKGVVTIIYKDYCDIDGWILNGECNTRANIHANGKMYGTVEITGVKPGKIYYENVIIKKGTSAGGTYGVQRNDSERSEVEYNVLPQEVEESIDDIKEQPA